MSDHLHCYRPDHAGSKVFPGQSIDEKVILLLRKHWIVDLFILVSTLLVVCWPFLLYVLINNFISIPPTIYMDIAIVIMHLYMLFALFIYYVKWIDHRFDLIIFTDRRMVDVNQTRLFNRKVSEANLAQIQDVASEIKGFIGSILNYGSINITTAGPDGHVFEMDFVRWPNLVASTIIELRDNYTRSQNKQTGTTVAPHTH